MKVEIRFHGRGGQGAVTASKLLAEAAYLSGFRSQSMPFFGAERRGAPVVAFARISDREIYETSQVYHPDLIAVLDPVILKAVDVFSGLKDGGVAVLNSISEQKMDFHQKHLHLITVDATKIAVKHGLLVSGLPVVNTTMLGAVVRGLEVLGVSIDLETLERLIEERFGHADVEAMRECYRKSRYRLVNGRNEEGKEGRIPGKLKVEVPISKPSAGVMGKTMFWRDFRPVIDAEKCNLCLNCWLHCPEGVVRVDDAVSIDYEYCKGCLVCSTVCPKGAIRKEREVFADAG